MGQPKVSIQTMPYIEAIRYFAGLKDQRYGHWVVHEAAKTPNQRFKNTSAYVYDPLPSEAVNKLIEYLEGAPNAKGIAQFDNYGGAVADRTPTETAFFHREASYNIQYQTYWTDPGPKTDDSGRIEWELDTQASTGMAPYVSQVRLYFGSDLSVGGLATSLQTWASDPYGPNQVNASVGLCEDNPALDGLLGPAQTASGFALAQAASEGRAFFASDPPSRWSGSPGSSRPVFRSNRWRFPRSAGGRGAARRLISGTGSSSRTTRSSTTAGSSERKGVADQGLVGSARGAAHGTSCDAKAASQGSTAAATAAAARSE